jgi:hypothetical protein
MESEFLTFEATDVELIGDVIEFDEEVQRGEKVRFYTLDEQVNDAFERMVPKGRTTRAQLEKLDKEVDRIRELYTTFVSPTAEGYDVIVPKTLRVFPWIVPLTPVMGYSKYSFAERWEPLFAQDAIRQPNGYVRMLTSLPSPYANDVGTPYPVVVPTEFAYREAVEQQGANSNHSRRVLPTFQMNKTRRHEDGRIDVMSAAVEGTADSSPFIGYWLKKRNLPIPDPLPGHPFLESNESRFIETTEPLSDVVPGLDAVLMHGVPVTTDPYGEGRKYLKIYDVSLDSVPWSLWKQRFPKVALVDVTPPPIDLALPEAKSVAPSSNILEQYGTQYFPGIAGRKWLMTQEDGGHLVVKMIQSLAGDAGTVATLPVAELGDIRFPDVDEDQCELVGRTFHDLAIQGVIRQWDLGKNRYNRKCLPLDIIKQERHQVGYRDRLQWKETTQKDILSEYTRALGFYRAGKPTTKGVEYAKQTSRAISQLRQQVVAVLSDEDRFPEDKLKAIALLTRDAPHTSKQVVDAEGLFVVCDHTLAILSGDMIADRLAFYDTWTARVDGARVCKVCGEHVNNDVLVHQEDFSEEGRLLKHADALETNTFHGAAVASYTTSLRAMQGFFDLEEPADGTMFLLISLLQLLPSQEHIIPVLQEAREIAGAIKIKDPGGKARGMVGIAATALLMQTHLPRLVPRRSFGSLPLKIDGFPRDTESDKAPTVIDSLMLVLRKTFEAYPTSFKGPSLAVMRGVLSEAPVIRKGVIAILKKMLPKFAAQLLRAKSEAELNPAATPPVGLVPVMLPPVKLGVITSFPACTEPRSMWADPRPPTILQPAVPLDSGIRPRASAHPMRREVVVPKQMIAMPVKDIQRRIKLAAVPNTQGDTWRTNLLIAQRVGNALDIDVRIDTIDVSQPADLLRDIAEGLVKETMATIARDPIKRRAYEELREKDITLFSLLSSLKDATTETNTLRAKERHLFTDRMRDMTDSQRQITKDLLDRGMAPHILTNADRDIFAAQLERELTPLAEVEPNPDIGVGAPRDAPDDDDRNADQGDYGDHTAQGNRERDQTTADLDRNGPI